MTKISMELKLLICVLVIFGWLPKSYAGNVRVAWTGGQVTQIAYLVSHQKGYYRAEGLDVEFIRMGASVANIALTAGEVHFSTLPVMALMAAFRGRPLVVLFSTYERPQHSVLGIPKIGSLKELKGKKVGVDRINSPPDLLLREVLRPYGLEVPRDVTVFGTGSQETRYAALVSGVVDAALLSPPFNFMAEENGFRMLAAFKDENLILPSGGTVCRRDFALSHPDVLRKFTRATIKGFIYARDNRSGTIPILAKTMKVNESLAAKIYDYSRATMTLDGTMSRDSQRMAVEFILKFTELKESPPLEQLFDFSLTRKAHGELEAESWKP